MLIKPFIRLSMPMKTLFVLVSLILLSNNAIADSIRKIDLQHRDASATQSLLLPLFEGDISMVVDGNSLLVRGASADLQALADMVKRLDQPQQSLRVSLYRGVDPYRGDVDSNKRQISTTRLHHGNVLDQWIMEDGTELVITDKLKKADSHEQLLVVSGDDNLKALLETKRETKVETKAETKAEKKGETKAQHSEQSENKVRLTLSNDKQSVRVEVKTVLASRATADNDNQDIISTELASRRIITINQWERLFFRQNQAEPLDPKNNAMATTLNNFNDEQALWIRVSLED